jgi:hypothetical protein
LELFALRRATGAAESDNRRLATRRAAGFLFSIKEVPTSSLTPETLQILGQARKSLCKPFVYKARDIALARTG